MFNTRFKLLRAEKGMTQEDLSKKILIGRKTISDYERGISKPDLETLHSIANFFNVSADYLLGLTDDRNGTPTPSAKDQLKGVQLAFYNQAEEITEEQAQEVLQFIEFIKNRDKK